MHKYELMETVKTVSFISIENISIKGKEYHNSSKGKKTTLFSQCL